MRKKIPLQLMHINYFVCHVHPTTGTYISNQQIGFKFFQPPSPWYTHTCQYILNCLAPPHYHPSPPQKKVRNPVPPPPQSTLIRAITLGDKDTIFLFNHPLPKRLDVQYILFALTVSIKHVNIQLQLFVCPLNVVQWSLQFKTPPSNSSFHYILSTNIPPF